MTPIDKALDEILYNLESEYMNDMQRVYKGKDTGVDLARNNIDSSERAKAALTTLIQDEIRKELKRLRHVPVIYVDDNGIGSAVPWGDVINRLVELEEGRASALDKQ